MDDDPRPLEAIRRQFEVERELAARLLNSSRTERTQLFKSLYAELFTRVTDHPRMVRRDTEESSARAVAARMRLLEPFLPGVKTFLEFAPGDCRLAFEVCKRVNQVIGVDISDQSGEAIQPPPNFKLLVYDGYRLDLPENSADLAFSYQFLEHLHPDDMTAHFELIHRVLRPGGAYVFSTPHRYSGPHDISRFFSDVPQGFHLKEWTFRELGDVARRAGFSEWFPFRSGKPRRSALAREVTCLAESGVGVLPRALRKPIARRLFLSVISVAIK